VTDRRTDERQLVPIARPLGPIPASLSTVRRSANNRDLNRILPRLEVYYWKSIDYYIIYIISAKQLTFQGSLIEVRDRETFAWISCARRAHRLFNKNHSLGGDTVKLMRYFSPDGASRKW